MKIIEVTPEIYKRIDKLSENYSDVEVFVERSLKNYLSKKAVELEKVGWHCEVSMQTWYRDAAEREAKRCALVHAVKGCGWVYKP